MRSATLALYCKSPTLRINPPLMAGSTMFFNSIFKGVKAAAFFKTSLSKAAVNGTAVVTVAPTLPCCWSYK